MAGQKSNSLGSIRTTPRHSEAFASKLLEWYDAAKRDLPWRRTRDPYAILISEFMLQQTQVSTVIPYYERFLADFPTIEALARASEQEVLHAWAGLGYYSRARNLRAAALRVMEAYGGKIPDQFGDLLFLPGVGRYMAGAVASIAFNRQAPAVDTNVIRVLCRVFAAALDAKAVAARHTLEDVIMRIIPKDRPGDFNQALMDLGSQICTPREPLCGQCPLSTICAANREGKPEAYPVVAKPVDAVEVAEACAVIRDGSRYFVTQCAADAGRYRGMWEFPTVTLSPGEKPGQALTAHLKRNHGLSVRVEEEWASIRHQVTHHKITKHLFLCSCSKAPGTEEDSGEAWATLEELANLPMGAPHKRIVGLLGESEAFFSYQ